MSDIDKIKADAILKITNTNLMDKDPGKWEELVEEVIDTLALKAKDIGVREEKGKTIFMIKDMELPTYGKKYDSVQEDITFGYNKAIKEIIKNLNTKDNE